MRIVISETAGRCRWCRCTDTHGCANGCWWANDKHTLCSECVDLDAAMRSARGRAEIAEAIHDHQDTQLVPALTHAPRPRRRR